MRQANLRSYDYRQDDSYPYARQDEPQREREYYAKERGDHASANYPQFGAAGGRAFHGNDAQYDDRSGQFRPAHDVDPSYSYRYGSPLRFYPQHAGNDVEGRYYTGYPAYERDSRFFGAYRPDPVGMVRQGYPDFYGLGDADFDIPRRHQPYPAHSPRYLGGAYPGGWDQGHRDWESTGSAGEGRHGARSGWDQGAPGVGSEHHDHARHVDPDYHQWRQEQIRNLDSDYNEWRRERYDKFSNDFNTWRSNRPARDSQRTTAVPDLKETAHSGSPSTATTTGVKK